MRSAIGVLVVLRLLQSWWYRVQGLCFLHTDSIIQAKSGTGKTVAFAAHALQRLLLTAAACEPPTAAAAAATAGGFFGFVLAVVPSRELAMQTATEMRNLAGHIQQLVDLKPSRQSP